MKQPNKTIYLDHAATTPIDPMVAEVVYEVMQTVSGNPSAMYTLGREAKQVLEDARQRIATSLEVNSEEITFTGSGTESDNLAIIGAARARQHKGRHIVVSAIEHKAVLAAAKRLESEGWEVTYLPVDGEGLVAVENVIAAIRPDTSLVSVMYANNEIGTIEPIVEIGQAIRTLDLKKRPLFHTDACQALGYLPVKPRELGVDLLTINGSKIYGPKGTGALWRRSGVRLEPQVVGGDQEFSVRAGTENVALAAGMALAVEKAVSMQSEASKEVRQMRDYFLQKLKLNLPEIIVNGSLSDRLPNNLHITVPELEGESLVLELDQYGICAATGSACSAQDLTPSHVLQAIGVSDELIHGSLRFSLGRSTTKEEIDYVVEKLQASIKRLRSLTAVSAVRLHQLV